MTENFLTRFAPARWPFFYGWMIVPVGTLGILMSVPGQTIGVSVFTDHLIDALGLTRDQLSAAYMMGTIGSALLLTFAGRFYDRFGARRVAFAACISIAAVLIMLSFSDGIAARLARLVGTGQTSMAFVIVFLGFFALRFWGQGVLVMASGNMTAKWFDHYRGLVSGIVGTFVALGFSLAPKTFEAMIARFGWRSTWHLAAIVVGVFFTLVVLLFYRDNPQQYGLEPDGFDRSSKGTRNTANSGVYGKSLTLNQACRTWGFWVFTLGMAMSGLYQTGLMFHVVSIFEEAGIGRASAVAIFIPAAAVGVVAHLSAGLLSNRIKLHRLLMVMMSAMALSMFGAAFLRPGLPVVMIIAGNGISGGMVGLLSAITWPRLFGVLHLGAIRGLNMSIVVLFSAIGPFLFSQSLSRTGSYRTSVLMSLVVAVLILAASLRSCEPEDNKQDAYAEI